VKRRKVLERNIEDFAKERRMKNKSRFKEAAEGK
jgi:hypothetical protein